MAVGGQAFVMHGAREAITAGLAHIEQQVDGIEAAIEENAGLAFDLSKTLIESTCKKVLTDRNIEFDPAEKLPKLFKLAAKSIPLTPPELEGSEVVIASLNKTLAGLVTAIHGVCELRNLCGFASHGDGNPKPRLEIVHALLAAETADAVVGFLYRAHTQHIPTPTSPERKYEDQPEFNEYVDENNEPIAIFREQFQPSKVLFDLAQEPYRIYLAQFLQDQGDDAAEEDDGNGQ